MNSENNPRRPNRSKDWVNDLVRPLTLSIIGKLLADLIWHSTH